LIYSIPEGSITVAKDLLNHIPTGTVSYHFVHEFKKEKEIIRPVKFTMRNIRVYCWHESEIMVFQVNKFSYFGVLDK